ncbi:DUF2530 domain-containing protein, partial [Nocardiopsis prasina]|uniref:DUF2530 domain-containing protein n=1 Tax=Nocardiopsis prasina TaxID=2015 RepID=UPI00036DE06F
MRRSRKPDPEVMESDYRLPTALGTAAWAAALIALLAMGDDLAEQDRWWRWVCLTGAALGVFGFLYIPRHLRNSRGAGAPQEPEHSEDEDAGGGP